MFSTQSWLDWDVLQDKALRWTLCGARGGAGVGSSGSPGLLNGDACPEPTRAGHRPGFVCSSGHSRAQKQPGRGKKQL